MSAGTRNPNLEVPVAAPPRARADGDPLVGPRDGAWWTGQPPRPGACPGVGEDGVIRSLAQPNLETCTRDEVLDYFENGWTLTETLFSALQGEEAFTTPPYHGLRHPLVFYYGHVAALAVNKLRLAGLLDGPVDAAFEQLFETGVDEMSWDDMAKNDMEWPAVRSVTAYRRRVHDLVRRVIETAPGLAPGHEPITDDSPLWALMLSLEHERIHLETSSVLVRETPLSLLRRPEAWPPLHASAGSGGGHPPRAGRDFPPFELVDVGPLEVVVGKDRGYPAFGWDNEYGRRVVAVRPFQAGRFLVTNGEYHAFVADGGYHERRFWSDEGWRFRQGRNARWPTFWAADGPSGLHRYALRTLFEIVRMPWAWPVEVNWHEAKAYCAWLSAREGGRTCRLLTEPEHLRLRDEATRDTTPGVLRDVALVAGGRDMAARGLNLGLAFGSPTPVDLLPPSSEGVHDARGNAWQWIEDDFNPLEGFRVHRYYDDFSATCFDGEHAMILGGSFVSTGSEASLFARFHFRRHFFQHAGFRVARPRDGDAASDAVRLSRGGAGVAPYETERAVGEYVLLHHGRPEDVLPPGLDLGRAAGFPRRMAGLVADVARARGVRLGRALDVGCAVGGTTFELARHAGEVVGVDLSAAFIEVAELLRREGRMEILRREEGSLGEIRVVTVAPDIDRGRVSFRRADACALPPDLHGFDAVVISNLLCRIPSPRALLGRMGGSRGLVAPGGLLLLASPYTWMEEFTPQGAWLGGGADGTLRSAEVVRSLLSGDFELVHERDDALVIREHARKFQLVLPHVTVWRRT